MLSSLKVNYGWYQIVKAISMTGEKNQYTIFVTHIFVMYSFIPLNFFGIIVEYLEYTYVI